MTPPRKFSRFKKILRSLLLAGGLGYALLVMAAEVTIDDDLYDVVRSYGPMLRVVFIDDTDGYAFFVRNGNVVSYKKTTDGGDTWGTEVDLPTDATNWWAVSIWYDQWTPGDTSGTKIHIAANEITTDDVHYNYLDTSDDSLRSGGWVSGGDISGSISTYYGNPSITKSTDGYLFMSAFASSGHAKTWKSTDDGDNWSDSGLTPTSSHVRDLMQLLPLGGGDILGIYQDYNSALYYYEYDEGADSWGSRQTLDSDWAAGLTEPNFGASLYKATGDVYLAGSNNPNTTGNDVRAYKFDESARSWSQLTDVLTDEVEAGQAAMLIDDNNGDLYAVYIHGSAWGSSTDVYYKMSDDDGSTWGSATQLNSTTDDIKEVFGGAMSDDRLYVVWENDDLEDMLGNTVADLTPSGGGGGDPDHIISISGTVYTDEGSTNIGSSKTVALSIEGGSVAKSAETNASGQYSMTGAVNTGSVITLFLDDETEDAVTVTINDGGNRTGMDLYQDRLIVRSDSGSVALTNTHLDDGKPNDSDVFYNVDSGTLQVDADKELFVWSGDTYQPGGPVRTHDFDIRGTANMGTNVLTVSGSLIANGGVLNTSTGILIIIPTETTEALSLAGSTIQNLQIGIADALGAAQSPIQDSGVSSLQSSGNYNMGYAFTPNVDGYITQLWGNCGAGSRTMYLYSCDNGACSAGTQIASVGLTTTGLGNWVAEDVTPVAVEAGQEYIVSLHTGASSFCYGSLSMPTTIGDITVHEGRYGSSTAFPATLAPGTIYGISDITFQAGGMPEGGSGTVALGSHLFMSGNVDLQAGTLTSGNGYSITLSGSWTNWDTFTSTGTVTFDGTSQTISGSTTFYNLTKSVTSADTLTFYHAGTQTVSGALILQGAASNLLSIRSSLADTAASLILDGDAGSQTIQYLNVQDSDASGGAELECLTATEGCVNNGNNTNWNFGGGGTHTISISGTVYTDEGSTNIGSSKTVAVSIDGAAASDTAETNGSGQFTLTGVEANTGAVLTLFLDDETEDAVTVTINDGGNRTGMNLYQDRLITRSDNGVTALTITHLNTANNSGDSDIDALYILTDSNTNLQVKPDKELYVWTGDTFTPGGKVFTHDLEVLGTLTLGTNTLVASGSLVANAGTLTTSTGIILKSLADSTTTESLTLGTNEVEDLTLDNGLVGYWKLDDGTGSTIARDSSSYAVNGSLTNFETSTDWKGGVTTTNFFNRHALEFDGSDECISLTRGDGIRSTANEGTISVWMKKSSLGNTLIMFDLADTGANGLVFMSDNSSGKPRLQYWGNGGSFITIDVTSTISTDVWYHVTGTWGPGGGEIYLNGALEDSSTTPSDVVVGAGTSYIGCQAGSLRYFPGNLDDVRLYNRALSASEVATLYAGSPHTGSGYYTLGSALSVNGNFQNYGSILDVSNNNYPIHLTGSWLNVGSLEARNGTVYLRGTSQTMTGNTAFYSLDKSVSAADTLTFDYTSRQTVSGALILQGAASNLLSIRSTQSGSAALLILDGDTGSQTIQYLNVQDSDASGGLELICYTASEGCVDNGNNTNWLFEAAASGLRNFFYFFGF